MTMLTRSFEVPEDLDSLLASRADAESLPKAELARRFVSELLQLTPSAIQHEESSEVRVLRRYHLEREDDHKLERLSKKLDVSKGRLFRAALRRGLAVQSRTGAVSTQQQRARFASAAQDLLVAAAADVDVHNIRGMDVLAAVLRMVQMLTANSDGVTRSQLREEVGEEKVFEQALSVVLRQRQVQSMGQQVQLIP